MKSAITEKELVLPALLVLAQKGGYLTTGTLKKELKKRIPQHKKDIQTLSGGVTRFNKTVGNLISHRTLSDFVKYKISTSGEVAMKINARGINLLYGSLL